MYCLILCSNRFVYTVYPTYSIHDPIIHYIGSPCINDGSCRDIHVSIPISFVAFSSLNFSRTPRVKVPGDLVSTALITSEPLSFWASLWSILPFSKISHHYHHYQKKNINNKYIYIYIYVWLCVCVIISSFNVIHGEVVHPFSDQLLTPRRGPSAQRLFWHAGFQKLPAARIRLDLGRRMLRFVWVKQCYKQTIPQSSPCHHHVYRIL